MVNHMQKKKELLFSVTKNDCNWQYLRGSGKGGQKKNKTNSAVRCVHKASGAVGYAENTRSQFKNKQLAFKRMTDTKEFKNWHTIEVSRRTGRLEAINKEVDRQMSNIKIETQEKGKWTVEND